MYIYLTMTVGSRAGISYLLDANEQQRIGRDAECEVMLDDPLTSRVHALINHLDGAWQIRDAGSRNGTYVNDQKIDTAVLADGNSVRVGSTEFTFHISEQPPTVTSELVDQLTETVIKNQQIGPNRFEPQVLASFGDAQHVQELLMLYQFSIKLLGCESPEAVVHSALDLISEWTRATVVGFLWPSDEGELKPHVVIPPEAAHSITLSRTLTDLVWQERQAIWVANARGSDPIASLQHYADAVCVPLVNGEAIVGAIHAYLEQGRFRPADFDFVISAANIATVALMRARRERSLTTGYEHLAAKLADPGQIIGHSAPMKELKNRIGRMARATGCVLITGESGTGKELIARAVHEASSRADRSMLCVNCAAIPTDLMDSQLFGHKAGSFTGADRDHVGYFQQADLGTLFLDEVGEMTLEGQAKLLRILEGHPFLPIGAREEVRVDVRVIAATNRDLRDYVKERKFREDLYYRLKVFELHSPPLRERGEDIGLLLDFFLEHFRRQHGRPGLQLSKPARAQLLAYNWPGNVRQLRNVVDSAVVMAEGPEIKITDLGLQSSDSTELESLNLEGWEKRLIGEALRRASGSVPEAAQLLGIGRATLYRKIEQYDIAR